jgi:hypothetical protein
MKPLRRCDEPKQQALGPDESGPSHFTKKQALMRIGRRSRMKTHLVPVAC